MAASSGSANARFWAGWGGPSEDHRISSKIHPFQEGRAVSSETGVLFFGRWRCRTVAGVSHDQVLFVDTSVKHIQTHRTTRFKLLVHCPRSSDTPLTNLLCRTVTGGISFQTTETDKKYRPRHTKDQLESLDPPNNRVNWFMDTSELVVHHAWEIQKIREVFLVAKTEDLPVSWSAISRENEWFLSIAQCLVQVSQLPVVDSSSRWFKTWRKSYINKRGYDNDTRFRDTNWMSTVQASKHAWFLRRCHARAIEHITQV